MRKRVTCFVVSAITLMGVHASARAEANQGSESVPTTTTESAPASDPSPKDGARPEPAPVEAAPTPVAPPVPPPPACVPPAPAGPPPGTGYYGPPPGYPYPPPHYRSPEYGPPPRYPYGYPYPRYPRYDSPLPDEERRFGAPRRPTMMTLGFGMAAFSGSSSVLGESPAHRSTEMGFSYTLRMAFAANDSWSVVLGMEGTTADFSGDFEGVDSFTSTIFTVGAQYFIKPWLYSRLSLGLGCLSWDSGRHDELTCMGMAATGGVGFELFQSENMSTGLELAGSAVMYTTDSGSGAWPSLGLNLVLSFF